MGYQSTYFLLFSAMVIFLYYCVGRKLQKFVILTASVVFILFYGVKYLPFVAVTLSAAYFCALGIRSVYRKEALILDSKASGCESDKVEGDKNNNTHASNAEIKARSKKAAKRYLHFFFLISVGMLVVCKYAGFIETNVNWILAKFHIPQLPMFDIILPVGISFYTFMAIGYVLDVYWKRYEAETNFVVWADFLLYFPHFVQGPIERFDSYKDTLKNGVKFSIRNLSSGGGLLLWGLFKKLVIADRLNIFVNSVYDNYTSYEGLILALATVVYAIQLYADFSGCIDIVSGISEMMGIKLMKNFNHPYFSQSIPEFWRRWHISLCEWFKDYIYLPLSTSHFVKSWKKKLRSKNKVKLSNLFATIVPTITVWVITGIWHGASWKFVAWGAYYAILMVLGLIFKDTGIRLCNILGINTKAFSWKCWLIVKTFILTCIGRVFFRADSLDAAVSVFKRIFSRPAAEFIKPDVITSYGLDSFNMIVAIAAIVILWIIDLIQERTNIREYLATENMIFKISVIVAGVMVVLIFGMYGPGFDASSFVYEQF